MRKLIPSAIAILTIALLFQRWQARPDYNGSTGTTLAPQPGQSEHGTVEKISDGDTITALINGRRERIRLCGIDAPEKEQPLGEQAREQLRSLAGNQIIIFPTERDRYGRLVAELFSSTGRGKEEERFINYEMIKSGMAYRYAQYSDRCPNGHLLAEAEQQAKAKRLGVWAGNYQKPWDFRKSKRST